MKGLWTSSSSNGQGSHGRGYSVNGQPLGTAEKNASRSVACSAIPTPRSDIEGERASALLELTFCREVLQCNCNTMALTRIKPKFQVTIPQAAREAVGLKVGDFLEATPTKEGVLLRPKQLVDRKVELDRGLERALADVAAGRVMGPFKTASATMRALKQRARARHSR